MPDQQPWSNARILEAGNITFFYRPKKGVLHPRSPDDLERVYFILVPDDRSGHKNRLLNVAHGALPEIVPGKRLPEELDWAFVEDVDTDPAELLRKLEKDVEPRAAAMGTRARPFARAAGQGRYAIAKHGDHTHLVYRLSEPAHPGDVQKELKIKPEASYVVSVKDPFAPSEIELKDKPGYPDSLRKKFDGQGWIPIEPTSYLDYRYTQIVLIGATTDVQKELGIDLRADVENEAEKELRRALQQEDRQARQRGISLTDPLEQGRWQ